MKKTDLNPAGERRLEGQGVRDSHRPPEREVEPEKTARADLPRETAGADGADDRETGRFMKTGDNLDRDPLPLKAKTKTRT